MPTGGYSRFGVLVNFASLSTYKVFKCSQLLFQILCTCFISIFTERNANSSAIVEDRMFLQMKITQIICQKKNTSFTRTNRGSSERLHQEVGKEQLASFLHWKNKQSKSAVEFIRCMMGMARLLVVFFEKFRQSKKRQGKSWERTVRPVVTLRRWFSRIHSFFVIDRSQLTAVYCNRRV